MTIIGLDANRPPLGRPQVKVAARVVKNVRHHTILPIVAQNIQRGAKVFTDEHVVYQDLPVMASGHATVLLAEKVYVAADAHTNSIGRFWSQTQNERRDVHHADSAKYLQHYLAEYAFRYNHRDDGNPMLLSFLWRSISSSPS